MNNFKTVVSITNDFIAEYPQSTAWQDSPFNWIRCLPPGSKGVIGRAIGSGLLQSNGFTVTARTNQLRVNAQGILVRIALMWEEGVLKFQNLREPDFDHVLCFGLCPNEAFAWFIPKEEVWKDGTVRTDNAGVTAQHKGADAWISINLSSVPLWLKPYGGTLDEMVKVAKTAL